MVLVHLMGGLGNQMFQYAAGRALSSRIDLPLKVYFDDHYKLAKRNFALDCFQIEVEFPSKSELKSFLPDKGIIRKIKQLSGQHYTGKLFREKALFDLDAEFFQIKQPVYLSGFWQNIKYFSEIEDLIRKEFAFSREPGSSNVQTINEIESKDVSCSIHIRRTDYTNPASGLYALPIDYYKQAITEIESRTRIRPHYFIFSDDAEWVRENFLIVPKTQRTIISHNSGNEAHEDMRLMASCNHNIIANSSLSWWGAWLNPNKSKVVIAPKNWMKTGNNSINKALAYDQLFFF